MAPMEGMTGYVFRNAYQKYFGGMDKYFTPFISSVGFNHKERNDVLPEHNVGMCVIPQILTNRAEDFLQIAERLEAYGYDTVNLNLGCPSGTVVSKGRGAGFLGTPEKLEAFLDEIFGKCRLKISVKTRIGVQEPGEWGKLQEIYNRFPMEELIIHPRIQKDFYKHPVRLEVFREALAQSKIPVCYNGDIHSVKDYMEFAAEFPKVDRIMLGRGCFRNPGLADACIQMQRGGAPGCFGEVNPYISEPDKAGDEAGSHAPASDMTRDEKWFDTLQDMLAELLCEYRQEMQNDTHTLYKMKEIWTYLGQGIPDGERMLKKITKARSISEYKIAAAEALRRWREICCLYN